MRRRFGFAFLAAAVAVGAAVALGTGSPPAPPRERAAAAAPPAPAPVTSAPVAPTTVRPRRPNIVLVLADDMRVDDLRFAPRVRRLVGDRGLRFRNSFANYPLCCPARASLLVGRYAHNHRVFWHDPPFGYAVFDDSRTLATSLSAEGYRTGYIGKYLNGYGRMDSKVSGGPSYRYVPNGWSDWRASIDGPVPGVHGGTYNYFDIVLNVNGHVDNSHRGQYSTGVIGNQSVRMADRFAGRRPFFMYVNYVAPHAGGPIEADDPPRIARDRNGNRWEFITPARPGWVEGRFDDVVRRGGGMPRSGGPAEADVSDKPFWFRSYTEPGPRQRRWLRDVTRQRAEAVHVMDRQVGRLIRRLKRSGEWANTVFMFSSDNGYFLGEHRVRNGKVRAHEPSLRVPFLVTGPGMRSGESRFDPITSIDIPATILDLADADPPRRPDGLSRLPTMLEGDRGWRTGVLTEAAVPGPLATKKGFHDRRTYIGVRTARYSLIVNRIGRTELYDLVRDPREHRNVFRDSRYRQVRRSLVDVWNRLRNCAGAECRTRLPEALRAGPVLERRWTRAYWAAIDRVYGWR